MKRNTTEYVQCPIKLIIIKTRTFMVEAYSTLLNAFRVYKIIELSLLVCFVLLIFLAFNLVSFLFCRTAIEAIDG